MEEEYHNNSEPDDGDNLQGYTQELSTRWARLAPTLPYGAFKDDTDSDLFRDISSDLDYCRDWIANPNPNEPIVAGYQHGCTILINHAIDCLEYSTSGVTASLDGIIDLLNANHKAYILARLEG